MVYLINATEAPVLGEIVRLQVSSVLSLLSRNTHITLISSSLRQQPIINQEVLGQIFSMMIRYVCRWRFRVVADN